MTNIIKKNILGLIGVMVGAMGGYAYYYFIGCSSGSCPLTSNPYISVIFGAIIGYLFLDMFKKTEKKDVRFFETPLSVWANFPIDKKQFEGEFVAAHLLAPKVLEAAHVPLSPYYTFVNKVNSCYKAVHQTGTQTQKTCEFNQADVLKQYQDMNMDVLNGKNFTYQLLKPQTAG